MKKNCRKLTPLEMFKHLPHIDSNYNVVIDWGYTPNLYHADGEWHVSWIDCNEGDSLLDYSGKTAEEAIKRAYDEHKFKVYYDA